MGTSTITAPAPQADRLAVVASVVDAIAGGCETAEAISDAIGMSARQGAYYPNAARTLGYVEPIPNTSPVQWELTSLGEEFVALPTGQRTAHLAAALVANDELATFTAGRTGVDELAQTWSRAGYSEETVARRLQTIGAWADFLAADPADQARSLEDAAASARDRAPQAQQRAVAARAAKDSARAAAAKPEPVQGEMCTSCFIIKPVTGLCPDCD